MTLSSSSFLYFSFTWMRERGPWLYKRATVKQISPNLKLFFHTDLKEFPVSISCHVLHVLYFFQWFLFLSGAYLFAGHAHICIPAMIFSSPHPAVKGPQRQVQITQVNSFYCRSVMPCAHQPHCNYCTALLLNGQKYLSLERHHLSHPSEGFMVLLQ